jgi:histidinol-phosphatase (PHP family)
MYFDSHVHSLASPDSTMEPEIAVNAQHSRGVGITFTEHVDYVTPDYGFDPAAADKPAEGRDFLTDFSLYPHTYEKLRSDSVLLGLEIGMTAYYQPLNCQTAHAHDYDFILGAVHSVDGYDLYHDRRNTFDYDRKLRMLTYSLEMVELYDYINAFAHIDYISRYTPAPEKNVPYDDYANEYDALLKALARRDIALEINTARFGSPGLEANLARVYRRFNELGGRFVTIGSDAHTVENLGRYHSRAVAMAREAGLKPVYYKKRKRYACE